MSSNIDVTQAGKTRVFVSYSRRDKDRAEWLQQSLETAGLEVFRDVDDTLPGEEWWRRLTELIAMADAIVFLMSHSSSASKVCNDEVQYARNLNKRIFPAVLETIDWQAVPEGLAKIHSVFFDDPAKLDSALSQLVSAISTDIGWVREHTRLLDRARQWEATGKSPTELLTGMALEQAEHWLTQRPAHAEPPTNLHHDYIKASRDAFQAEQERLLRESEEQRKILQEQRDRAEASFRAGLNVVSETQQRIIDGLSNTRGVSLATREAITRVLLDATDKLKAASPDFYPSSVQQQLAANELSASVSLAQIYIAEGKFDEAERAAQKALDLSERFRNDDYNPLQTRPGLRQTARIFADLGDIKFRQEDYTSAIGNLQKSISLRRWGLDHYSKSSSADDFRLDLADGLQRLSVVSLVSGDSKAALETAQEALQLVEELREKQPEDTGLISTRAAMLCSLADALLANNREPEGQQRYEQADEIFGQLLQQSPDSLYLIRWKSITLERLGNAKFAAQDFSAAAAIFAQTLELKKQLVNADPGNVQFRNDLSTIAAKLRNANAGSRSPC